YAECRELHITDKVGDTKHRVILSVHTGKVPSYRCNPFQYPTKVVAVEVFQRRHHPRGARVVAIENDVPILTVDPSTQHVVAVRKERIHSLLYQTSLSVDIRLHGRLHDPLSVDRVQAYVDQVADEFGPSCRCQRESGGNGEPEVRVG